MAKRATVPTDRAAADRPAMPRGGDEATPVPVDALRLWFATEVDKRPDPTTLNLPRTMTRTEAASLAKHLWAAYADGAEADALLSQFGPLPPKLIDLTACAESRHLASSPRFVKVGGHTMPFHVIRRETRPVPDSGRALLICMHGGGRQPSADGPHAWSVNAREWQSQTRLAMSVYPQDGLYFVPRMADDRLGRWWHRHNQQAFEMLIRHAQIHWGVDPNRVYLLGISEGGYGTNILAPFMPDRFAAATALASGVGVGNPPDNLRNLPLRTDVGENDTMFDRAPLAIAYHKRLDKLHEQDPQGYHHSINIQEGRGHGIDYRLGVGWLDQHRRTPHPDVSSGTTTHCTNKDVNTSIGSV